MGIACMKHDLVDVTTCGVCHAEALDKIKELEVKLTKSLYSEKSGDIVGPNMYQQEIFIQENKIKELEKKLAEVEKENDELEGLVLERRILIDQEKKLNDTIDFANECNKLSSGFREKLKIAVEALEFMQTFKHPEYMNVTRGSMFEVGKEALEKIKEK